MAPWPNQSCPHLSCGQPFRDLLAEMARKEGLESARVSKAFSNDVLLALSCRESGCVLVTDNRRDFQRIRQFVQFEFAQPWPGGGAAGRAGHQQ